MYPRFLFVNNILIVVIVAWAVSLFFVILLQCRDPERSGQLSNTLGSNVSSRCLFYYAVSISGFITDIAILVSPIPVIYQLQMHWKTRTAAARILLLGAV